MKICYLILVHNNFKHLARLIEALNDDSNSFLIHIDKKAKEVQIPSLPNIKVIPQHIDIKWGGFSMIEATIALMQSGLENFPAADYYILISGVDYPIRSKNFLLEQLESGREFIDIAPLPVPFKPLSRYEYYYFDYNRRNLKHYNPLFIIEVLLKKLKIKRRAPFPVYAGSQWFALTRSCTSYIIETIKKEKSYIRFFKHTLVPDEAFFQTIIGNSSFFENVSANLTYTDWETAVPPALITERHIEYLKNHVTFNDEYGQRYPFFARKFDDNSEPLLRKIREELWNK